MPKAELPFVPLGMSREQAAAYIGIGATKFDELVRDRRMPRPKKIDGRKVWNRIEIEIAFAELPTDQGGDKWDKAFA
jgi:predicted DNA-binding transcriptional regulator AlpA